MPAGRQDIVKDGIATRFPHNDPTKGGRKPSIRKQLERLMDTDGKIVIQSKQIVETRDNGDIVVKMPTKDQMAMKLIQWAMSGKGNHSLKALQMLIDHIDGKAIQRVDHTTKGKAMPRYTFNINGDDDQNDDIT